MERTPLVLLVGALISLSALAGCITSASDAPNGGDPATLGTAETDALTHIAVARAAAASWSSGAKLVSVIATEGAPLHPVDPPFSWDTSADPNVGNGLAIVWTYAFAAEGQGKAFFVSINGEGATVYAHALSGHGYYRYDEPVVDYAETSPSSGATSEDSTTRSTSPCCYKPYLPELANPTTSSGAAATTANGNESYRDFGILHPVHGVTILLTPGESPQGMWRLNKQTASMYMVTVSVDGRTGNLTHVEEYPYNYPPYPEPPCCCCDPPCCEEPPAWAPPDYEAEYSASTWSFGPDLRFSFPVDYAPAVKKAVLRLAVTNTDHEPVKAFVRDAYGGEVAAFDGGSGEVVLTSISMSGTYEVIVEPKNTDFFVLEHIATLEVLVDYEPVPYNAVPADLDVTYRGALQGITGYEQSYHIPLQGLADALTLTLEYAEGVGSGSLSLRVYDMYGNVLQEQSGSGSIVIEDPEAWMGYTVGIVLRSPSLLETEYTLRAQATYIPWENVVYAEKGEAPTHEGHGDGGHTH